MDADRTLADQLLASAAALGQRASEGESPIQLFLAAAQDVTSRLQVDVCSIWELLPENSLILRAVVGAGEGMITADAEPLTDSPLGRAVVSRGPVIVPDLRLDLHFSESSFLSQQQLVGSLIVPIFGPQCVAGAIGAHTRVPRDFGSAELHFLQIIAHAISVPLVGSDKESEQRQKQLLRSEQMMALGQVAAGVAHELRNPLTAIKGLIQVNRKELEDRKVPSEDLRIIEHEIRRMERSLQNFLDFARPPVPKRRRLSLMPVIERVISLIQGRARKQQVSFEIPQLSAALWVEADQDLIQQLLLNLVLNALDAMPQGGIIQIDVQPDSAGQVLVRVRDTGPGIAPHILPAIFERFVSSKETGVGLGLPVSRRIAQEHGGDLIVENLPQGGASFTFRLPAATIQS
ncbi:MAG: ATP-binding protein [Planctomycetota bacterium]